MLGSCFFVLRLWNFEDFQDNSTVFSHITYNIALFSAKRTAAANGLVSGPVITTLNALSSFQHGPSSILLHAKLRKYKGRRGVNLARPSRTPCMYCTTCIESKAYQMGLNTKN